MSRVEAVFCRSALWRTFARRAVLPWALAGRTLEGACLEVGGGSGAMAEQVLERHPQVRLTIVDVDQDMTAVADHRLSRFEGRAATVTADVSALPFPDRSFDIVLSWLMLHHTITWEESLTEVRRVLRPGGVLIGYDLLDTAPARFIHRIDKSEHRLFTHDELRHVLLHEFSAADIARVGLGGLVARFAATRGDR